MIATVGLALLLQATAVPVGAGAPAATASRSLAVRTAGSSRSTKLSVLPRPDGQLVLRADLLATALGGSIRRLPNGHFVVTIPGAVLEFVDQSAFALTGAGEVVPLPAPVSVDGQLLYLPLAVVTDVFPRVGTGVLYDSTNAELRLFSGLLGKEGGPRVSSSSRPADVDYSPGSSTVFAPPPIRAPSPSPPSERITPNTIEERDTVGVAPSGDVLLGETGVSVGAVGGHPATAKRRLVVVDAGHGGPDNGMSGPIGAATPLFYEKDIALAVAMKVGRELRSRGIDVVQTRTRDTLIALSDRGRIANEQHGDLFLSIHVNAANMAWHDPAASRGFETYFLAEAKTEDARRVERMENEAVRFETGANAAQDEPLDFVIHDMAQNEQLRESAELADMIQHSLASVHPGPDRGVKQAGFRVLVTAYMPAVLVEIGFGTNSDEAHYLASPASQTKIASAIASATVAYLARYERRVSALKP